MDKRKVINAYRRGFITIQECGQILGIEDIRLNRMVQDSVENLTEDIKPSGRFTVNSSKAE
ncbi:MULTISPECIES: hypothetical protein [Paenibacillus]|uniref:Uncharacterized protein n=1 Tax=Paenibacillus azoreducens TaxID=116718 RepID=A0A919YF93_9BACL|nr:MULTISPECIES: hypothetical protein [Paenibacillus]MBE9912894.1 hypothetical protein [Paenibacillus donghaensis]GIO49546.1 hypothetical protein J34TS1_43110 [Paenibacillus azoreducens]